MTGNIRERRLLEEAEALWRAISPAPPPSGMSGARLLAAAVGASPAPGYDRLYSPHLRAGHLVRPR